MEPAGALEHPTAVEGQLLPGTRIAIAGEFSVVDAPRKLVYPWTVTPGSGGDRLEVVTVRFVPDGHRTTEVIVTHERISSLAVRKSHEEGWNGCLEGLALHCGAARNRL